MAAERRTSLIIAGGCVRSVAVARSVKTELPVSGPDYILLTLLQGHSARACGRSGDPSITVKAPVPKVATRPSFAAVPEDPSRERSVTVVQPRPALPPPRAVVAAPQPLPTVATAVPVAPPVASPSTMPLPPGRRTSPLSPMARTPSPSPPVTTPCRRTRARRHGASSASPTPPPIPTQTASARCSTTPFMPRPQA